MLGVLYKSLLALSTAILDAFVASHVLFAGRAWLRAPRCQHTIQPVRQPLS